MTALPGSKDDDAPSPDAKQDGAVPAVRPVGGSVHATVAGEIGQRIVRGDYPPGTILPNEAKWAETFKVSRSVVREAVKMLTAKSLLASRPKIGSRVEPRERWNLLDREVLGWYASATTPSAEDVGFLIMVQEFRRLVEPEAAAFAALRHGPHDVAQLRRVMAAMSAGRTPTEWIENDVRFHLAILAASGNDLFLPLGVIVETALRKLFQVVTPDHIVPDEVVEMHKAIERAIRLRRPEAARRAVRILLDDTDAIIARKRVG